MRRTNKIELDLDHQTSPKENDLNRLATGCAPCLKGALKIDKNINGRSLNEIRINEIKMIVSSIFESSKDVTE